MPAEDYQLPPAWLGNRHEVVLPVVGGLAGLGCIGVLGSVVAEWSDLDASERLWSVLLALALALAAGLAWRRIRRERSAADAAGPQERIAEPLERDHTSTSILIRDRRFWRRDGVSEPLSINVDAQALYLPEAVTQVESGDWPEEGKWLTIPWGSLSSWATSLDLKSNEVWVHRLTVVGGAPLILRGSDISDNVALMDAVRSIGQRPIRLDRVKPPPD